MTLLAAGITQTVIQEMMPPYSLDADLLAGAVTILPPPPPGASASWRQARLTRLVREISVLMPADAAQAKLAAQIVVFRETADDTLDRANVPGLTVEQVCRVRRAAADLTRTSATLERALSRRQEQPAAFFGTVLADQVDIAALDAVWCKGARADRPGAASVGVASVGAAAVPQPAASESAAPEAAASEPAAPERGTGIAPVGLVPVGLVPAARAPAGFAPAGLRPESESAPRATPLPDPTVHPMAGLSGGSGAPIHDGRPEARAA
jgi:hypothetical protein